MQQEIVDYAMTLWDIPVKLLNPAEPMVVL